MDVLKLKNVLGTKTVPSEAVRILCSQGAETDSDQIKWK